MNRNRSTWRVHWIILQCVFAALAWIPSPIWAQGKKAKEDAKRVVYKADGESQKNFLGKVITEAQDGGMLLLGTDGRIALVQPEEVISSEDVEDGWSVSSSDQLSAKLKEEFPKDFKIHTTKHYLFCYNTSDEYAKWTGALFERLHRGFYKYWSSRGWKLSEPTFPMVVLVFDSKASYLKYATQELGPAAESVSGYYNLMSNRVITFDLTGLEGAAPDGQRVNRQTLIREMLGRPEAERNVATIVHEAVHQIAYNSGLQVRLADNPVWVSEGLAVFFESPDLNGDKGGWGTIGLINKHNYQSFLQYAPQRDEGSLVQLLTDDNRFRDPKTMASAYGESWAFNYFLLKTKSKQYVEYLKHLSELPPLGEFDPNQRVADFKKFFGDDLKSLDRDFMKFMSKL